MSRTASSWSGLSANAWLRRESGAVGDGDPCAVAFDHDLLLDVRVFVLAAQRSRGEPDVLELRMPRLALHLLHVERAMEDLEVFEERMRADERFDVERLRRDD